MVRLNIDHVLLKRVEKTGQENGCRPLTGFISLHPFILLGDLGLQTGLHLLEAQQVVDRVVDRVVGFVRVAD